MRPLYKKASRELYNDEKYDPLRQLLLEAVGSYCAYCEAPVSVDVPIEHKAAKFSTATGASATFFNINGKKFPKNGFPDHAAQWRNLLIACSSCNTAKGNTPSEEQAREYLFRYGQTNDYKTDVKEELFMAALSWCVWPDTWPVKYMAAPPPDETRRLFTFKYSLKSQRELFEAKVLRKPPDKQWATAQFKKLWVFPNETYINTSTDPGLLLYRVQNSITAFKLNHYREDDGEANDRRTQNRTRTYQIALESLDDLTEIVRTEGRDGPAAALLARFIRDTALATGFWSVWAWVFSSAFTDKQHPVWSRIPDLYIQSLFDRMFKTYPPGEIIDENENTRVNVPIFPGTDMSRVPNLF